MGEDGKAFHVPPVRILKMEELRENITILPLSPNFFEGVLNRTLVNPKISQILIGGHYIT